LGDLTMTVDTEFGAHATDEQIHTEHLHEFTIDDGVVLDE